MSKDQKRILEQQLWNIANTLRGKMNADEFRDTLFYTHSFLNCVPKFFFYIFQSINWLEHNEASGVPSLSKVTIEKIQLSIPSFQEQTLIANFLSCIEKEIETEKKVLHQYGAQKKYLLQNLFI